MSPKYILQLAGNPETSGDAKILWHLHSLALQGQLESFAARFEQASQDSLPNLLLRGSHSRYASIVDVVNALCACGDLPHPRLLKAIANFIGLEKQEGFYRTNIGRAVWSTLDWCLEERRPCFIEGREGRGKTASAQAWFELHRGEARYVSLPGLGVQRDFFEALASAYGVNFSHAKAPNEIRWRIRDAIVRSGLVLIIDEAHHALPERHRAGRPPLIDFIDCDLCNAGVAVALISTPQFGPRLAEFEERTKWNAGQFRRRFSGKWCALPAETDETDFFELAKTALPHVGVKGIKLVVGYAGAFDRDVSGMFDLIRDARRRARKAKREQVTYQDLRDAYEMDRVPSENALAEAFKRPVFQRPGFCPAEDLREQCDDAAAALHQDRRTDFADPPPRRGTTPAPLVTA